MNQKTRKRLTSKSLCRGVGALLLTLAAAFTQAAETPLDRVVAIVGDDVVMQSELNTRLDSVLERIASSGTAAPSREEITPQVLEQLVLERLQLGIAKRNNFSVPDTQVNQYLRSVAAQQNMTLEQFVEHAHNNNMSLADIRAQIRDELIIGQIQQAAVRNNIRISLQEISNFLESEQGQFWKSPELTMGHIYLRLSANASRAEVERVTAEAEDIYRQLQEGADFRQLAIAKSSGQEALQGGDLEPRRAVQLPQALATAVNKLEVGEVTKPIRIENGIHLIKLYEKKGGEQQVLVTQYKVRHILLKLNELRDDEKTYNQLMEIREKINSGEADFATMAKEHSQDIGSMLNGGELGWSKPGAFVPEFEQMMESVEVGEVSYPFRSQFGWHILQVTETREQDFSGEVLHNQATEILRDQKFAEELELWLQDLRNNTYIEYKI